MRVLFLFKEHIKLKEHYMRDCNKGVNCDVCNCKYNINGCKCKLDTISVTMAGEEYRHFCGSYKER